MLWLNNPLSVRAGCSVCARAGDAINNDGWRWSEIGRWQHCARPQRLRAKRQIGRIHHGDVGRWNFDAKWTVVQLHTTLAGSFSGIETALNLAP